MHTLASTQSLPPRTHAHTHARARARTNTAARRQTPSLLVRSSLAADGGPAADSLVGGEPLRRNSGNIAPGVYLAETDTDTCREPSTETCRETNTETRTETGTETGTGRRGTGAGME